MTSRTGYVFREEFMWHNTGIAAGSRPAGGYVEPGLFHIESVDTKRRLDNLLAVSGLKRQLHLIDDFDALTEDEIAVAHSRDYINKVKQMSASGGGDAGELVPFGAGGYAIAVLSAAAPLAAARLIMAGDIDNAYVMTRPPGHHAEEDRGRGFCIFGNGVIAVKNLRMQYPGLKVAIVDWDVHHGNGTQKAFYADPATLVISIHQFMNYPKDSGFIDERGEAAGFGYNINVPLPPGSGHPAFLAAEELVIRPALARFKPDLIIVLSGYDASAADPMGRLMAHSETFRELTTRVKASAADLCNGRLLMVHEGGYSPAYVPFCGIAAVEALSGITTDVKDPFLDSYKNLGMQILLEHQRVPIMEAASFVDAIQ